MSTSHNTWSIVLAAGEGTRLGELTSRACGRPIPKQFCTLLDGPSLLQDALRRGRAVSGRERLCAIVAEQHIEWWPYTLRSLPLDNIFVQSANRGTAIGILMPLLEIAAREPLARVVFLPSDHHVAREHVLRLGIEAALEALDDAHEEVLLLGIEPTTADPELGYIVPSAATGGLRCVQSFVEKPETALASNLVAGGALWNSFIFASTVQALLDLFRERFPAIVNAMQVALQHPDGAAVDDLYRGLPELDFSRDILTGAEPRLRVVPVASCGWTDLGTPHRIGEALLRCGASASRIPQRWAPDIPLSLASAYLGSASDEERQRDWA